MLVLSRKEGERIFIGDNIVLTVVRCGSGKVRLGINAPLNVPVFRDELAGHLQLVPHPPGAAGTVPPSSGLQPPASSLSGTD